MVGYVILVKHRKTGKVNVSSEGYKSLKDAQYFLRDERDCQLYADPRYLHEDNEYGHFAKDAEYKYTIKEVIFQ